MTKLNHSIIHPSWQPLIEHSLATVDRHYLDSLSQSSDWLPGPKNIFNAFSQPLTQCHYILFGESPYPRVESANGYAFWDAAVASIWSERGLSKPVNRATSLRNFIKMLLVADKRLSATDTSQERIAAMDKQTYIETLHELFMNLHQQGFLLLNASLVLSDHSVRKNAKYWRPFINKLLEELHQHKPDITLLLFGKIAEDINHLPAAQNFKQLIAEHPYNISFIHNPKIIKFFKPLHLLNQKS